MIYIHKGYRVGMTGNHKDYVVMTNLKTQKFLTFSANPSDTLEQFPPHKVIFDAHRITRLCGIEFDDKGFPVPAASI